MKQYDLPKGVRLQFRPSANPRNSSVQFFTKGRGFLPITGDAAAIVLKRVLDYEHLPVGPVQ